MEIGAEYDQRVMSLLATARKRAAGERDSFLRLACQDEVELYREVTEALAWEERMGAFLQRPMIDFMDLSRPFHAGRVIADRFEILREIGEGGMGVVYEAFDRRRQQKIAIKAAKPGFQPLLSPELEGALKVRHPNICLVNEIHSTRTDRGDIDFLTMELLEGETLAAYLSKHEQLTRPAAAEIARQLCAGLAEAHRSGIIHRDLKTANIILCRTENGDMRAVITDFGLAGSATLESGDIAGTPGYMAPELLRGERTSKASDIYALGVILYEIAVGHRPGDAEEIETKGRLTRGLDPRWDRVIRRCLDPSPDARPADATEVIRGLEKRLLRKDTLLASGLAIAVFAAVASQQPQIHEWLVDHLWPPQSNVRLAVLPFEAQPGDVRHDDTSVVVGGILQDVSDRVAQLRSERRTVVVIPPHEALSNRVQTPEQAKQILHATHALQTSVHRDGGEFVTHASVVDLSTLVKVGELSGRYSATTVGSMPAALSGAVSLALRLQGDTASEQLSPAAAASYDRGLHLLRRDDQGYASAIFLFEEAARLDPRSPLPLAALVEARIMEFKIAKNDSSIAAARRALSAAESLNPDSIAVRLAAGLLHATTGEYEKARENYQRVHELDPQNVDAYLRTAIVYDELNMAERAIEAYRRAIELEPGYYKPYHDFGVFYYYRGQYREAAEQFKRSIERAPGRVEEYTNLAAAYSDLGDDGQAEQALLASLKLQPIANAWNSLGAIRAYQKNDAEAVQHYRRAVEMDAADYVYWLNLGDSARRLGLLTESAAAYGSAMDLARAELAQNPRRGLSRAYVAYFAARLGQPKAAQYDIEEAMKFSPGDSKVIRRAVLTYEALDRRGDAIGALGKAGPDLLHELDRHPDLADFSHDARFRELLAQSATGGR